MKKALFCLSLFSFWFMVLGVLRFSYSQQLEVKEGITSEVRGWYVHIKSDDGNIYVFATGRSTIFRPHRYPKIGEKVEIHYTNENGSWIAHKVVMYR